MLPLSAEELLLRLLLRAVLLLLKTAVLVSQLAQPVLPQVMLVLQVLPLLSVLPQVMLVLQVLPLLLQAQMPLLQLRPGRIGLQLAPELLRRIRKVSRLQKKM